MTGGTGPGTPRTGPPRLRTRRALVASVADQAVAAGTNIAVVVVAARQSTAETFGVFALVYTVFAVVLGAATAFVGQALVLSRGTDAELRGRCRAAARFTLAASTVVGGLLAVAALPFAAYSGEPSATDPVGAGVSGGELAGGFVALGLVLPLVLTQDGLRYGFALLGLPHRALAADTVRLVAVVPALAVQPDGSGPGRLVLVWGLSVLPALALGGWLLARATRGAGPASVSVPLRRGYLGRRFVAEFAVGNAGVQLAVIGLGAVANPLAVGALRGATTLFGPMNACYNAATGFGPPLLNRVTSDANKVRAAALAGGVLAVLAAVWTLVLVWLPAGLGAQLLGETWQSAAELLPATGVQYTVMALGVCGLLTLRVVRPRATLPIQIVFSAVSVGLLLGGYVLAGVVGAAWGLAAGSAAKSVAVWLTVRRHVTGPGAAADGA